MTGHVRVRRPVEDVPPEIEISTPINIPDSEDTVVGIDQSLTGTGVVVLSGNQLSSYCIKPKKRRGMDRIRYIRGIVMSIVKVSNPNVIVMEGYGFGARGSRVFDLGELGGVLKMSMYESGELVHIAPPSVLKKFATGKGNADKSTVSKELFKRFGVDLNDDNEVDAAGLAIMGHALINPGAFDGLLTLPQKAALEGVDELF